MRMDMTNFCASPARRRKALVTSVLVKLPVAREKTKSSVNVVVISTSRGDSSAWGIPVTLPGKEDGTSGMGGWI